MIITTELNLPLYLHDDDDGSNNESPWETKN